MDDRIQQLDQFTTVIRLQGDGDGAVRSHQLAGAGSRCLAAMADLALATMTFLLMGWLVVRFRPELVPPAGREWIVAVAFIEWHIIYMMLFESFTRGLSPGKSLVRLRVITTGGDVPRPAMLVVRNLLRLADMALGLYLGSLAMVATGRRHQRLGDMAAGTCVAYSIPLVLQLEESRVPESLYSTSEDGYLLQSWITREAMMDDESRMASAVDLAAYLYSKYDDGKEVKQDAMEYLRELYEAESETGVDVSAPKKSEGESSADAPPVSHG